MPILDNIKSSLKYIFGPTKKIKKRTSRPSKSRPENTKKKRRLAQKPKKRKVKKKTTSKRVRKKVVKVKKKKTRKKAPKTKSVKKKSLARKKPKPKKKKLRKVKQVKPTKVEPIGILVGEITHYFSRIEVCVLKMTNKSIKVGDEINIKGKTTDFTQKIKSLQIESVDVKTARKGQLVGLKIKKIAKPGDQVYKCH